MTTDGDLLKADNIRTEPPITDGGVSSGEIERCKAILKIGSYGWNGQRVSLPGERCRRKHKLIDGLCWVHRTPSQR